MLHFGLLAYEGAIFLERTLQTFLASLTTQGLILLVAGSAILAANITLLHDANLFRLFLHSNIVEHGTNSTR